MIYCRYILARIYKSLGKLGESEQTYKNACELYFAHFPHSIQYLRYVLSLKNLYNDLNTPLEAEEHLMKGSQLCSTHFPDSVEYAEFLIR